MQGSGQKVIAKAEELIKYRKTQKNIEMSIETMTLCLPGAYIYSVHFKFEVKQ